VLVDPVFLYMEQVLISFYHTAAALYIILKRYILFFGM
jgi:hypothetical protein